MARDLEKGDRVIATSDVSIWNGVYKGDEGVVIEEGGWGAGPTVDFGDGRVVTGVDEAKLAKRS